MATQQSPNRSSRRNLLLIILIGTVLAVFVFCAPNMRAIFNSARCQNQPRIMYWYTRPQLILGFNGDRETICTDGSGTLYQSTPQQLANADYIVYSPDGKRIAFTSSEIAGGTSHSYIYTANADGSDVRQIADIGTETPQLAWSPNSQRLSFVADLSAGFGIYVVDLTCLGASTSCASSPSFLGYGLNPSWSPNGEKIAFEVNTALDRDLPNLDIYVMDADGSNRIDLTPDNYQEMTPAWSPDGRLIAFYSSRDPNGIYTINPNGTDISFLTDGSNPTWSSDGKYIAFKSERDNRGKVIQIFDWNAPAQALYLISRDGTKTTRLTFNDNEYIKSYIWLPH
jgi:Tol biopolymer transport system component